MINKSYPRNLVKIVPVLLLLLLTGCNSHTRYYQAIAKEKERISRLPEKTPDPSTIPIEKKKKIIDVSKDDKSLTPPTPIEGNLIQTGGVVAQLATQLTIDLNVSGSNVSQIIAMQQYIQNHWHYIHDPQKDHDTWRSAEATIRLRHNGKFPGDCDDFAILMASLAKQIGLHSRMVGGNFRGKGHAWAEFRLEPQERNNPHLRKMDIYNYNGTLWVSLDWFKGKDHERYIHNIIIFDNL